MSSIPDPTTAKPRWIGVGVSLGLLALSLAALVAQVAASALLGEDESLTLAFVLLPTAASGWLPIVAAALLRRKPLAVSVGVPVALAVLTWMAAFVATGAFVVLIWPTL